MRRAVVRIGEALVDQRAIGEVDDVFFLTRDEALAAIEHGRLEAGIDVAHRRGVRAEQARLVPPLLIGAVNPVLRRVWDAFPRTLGAAPSDDGAGHRVARISGPGDRGGPRHPRPGEFDELQPGEILVAPMTAPAWTPLFSRAAAVVTDVGSAAAHASIIAREYGIPAVVGCGDATARLQTGMRVTVDGSTGNVEPE